MFVELLNKNLTKCLAYQEFGASIKLVECSKQVLKCSKQVLDSVTHLNVDILLVGIFDVKVVCLSYTPGKGRRKRCCFNGLHLERPPLHSSASKRYQLTACSPVVAIEAELAGHDEWNSHLQRKRMLLMSLSGFIVYELEACNDHRRLLLESTCMVWSPIFHNLQHSMHPDLNMRKSPWKL